MLMRLLVARLGTVEEAEDALQELWLRLGAVPNGPLANPQAYLFRMASNLATDRRIAAMRRGSLETAWSDVQPAAAEHPDAERLLVSRESLRAAQAVLAAMPERMRTAWRLFRIEELPQRLIADRLEISVSGVEKLLRRAYARFHHLLEADPGDDE